jgi:hypothetical protein
MSDKAAVLIHANDLRTVAQLIDILATTQKYFVERGQPVPPLPRKPKEFAGCELLITELQHENGARIGTISLSTATGDIRYQREWVIAPPHRPN